MSEFARAWRGADVRVMLVATVGVKRGRGWLDASATKEEEPLQEFLLVPRSAGWCLALLRHAGSIVLHHENWRSKNTLG